MSTVSFYKPKSSEKFSVVHPHLKAVNIKTHYASMKSPKAPKLSRLKVGGKTAKIKL
jgi:hypothetical protein